MKVEVNFESIGPAGFIGKIITPRRGVEIKAANFDEMLAKLRQAYIDFGAPLPPSAPIEPTPLPFVPPRTPRHARRDPESAPPITAVPAPQVTPDPMMIPVPLGKRGAQKMREAADHAAELADPTLAARRAAIAGRRL